MMNREPFNWSIVPVVLTSLAAWVTPLAGATDQEMSEVQSLLSKHCVSCHGQQSPKADLRLDMLSKSRQDDYHLLDELVSRVVAGDMPPKTAKQPLAKGDRDRLLTILKKRLVSLESARLPGMYRKLTAQEYNNTLIDVFGVGVTKLSDLPFDSEHDIKKIGEHQVVTSYAAKKYYQVANAYLDRHLIHEDVKPRKVTFTAANGKDLVGRQYTSKQGAIAGGGNPPIFILRSPVSRIALEGEYELAFDWYCFYGSRTDLESAERTKPVRPPSISFHPGRTGNLVLNPISVGKEGGIAQCAMDKPIRIRLNAATRFLSFRGPGNEFKMFDREDPRYLAVLNSDLPKDKRRAALKAVGKRLMDELHGGKQMFLLIRGATFHGPLNRPETEFNKRLFGDMKRTDPIERCLPLLKDVATKLFRRPVGDAVLEDYYKIARREHAGSGNTYQAVKAALNAMLCSPLFIFKHEGSQNDLDDHMIASRLSFFLWNGPPDEELMQLAAQGKLRDPAVRRRQALRMMGDHRRARRFINNFTRQWLGLDKFGAYMPNTAFIDDRRYRPLKPAMEEEPARFFGELLEHNLSALNLIHSEFVVWNKVLADHYSRGTPDLKYRWPRDADRAAFRRIDLQENPGQRRGGLVTMASILSLTTDGENTQPILRGVWIARRMLGMEIEPPSSVPAIEVNLENVSKPREILAKHKTDPGCYVCHVKFDHFGLAMEHYDVIGRWKTRYVHPVQNEKGRFELVTKDPIDAQAQTPDGKPLPGVAGVKAYLKANQDVVMENLIKRLFAYALGREVLYKDRAAISLMLRSAKQNEYQLKDMVLDLVTSGSFIRR